jgi:23S rRNA (guanosine2251-2'-O)-methyltransferase
VTPSLNASVATALLLYEVARRGWMKGLRGSQPAPRLVRPQLPVAAAVPEPELQPEPEAPPEPLPEPEAPAAEAPVVELGLTPAPPAGFSGDIRL